MKQSEYGNVHNELKYPQHSQTEETDISVCNELLHRSSLLKALTLLERLSSPTLIFFFDRDIDKVTVTIPGNDPAKYKHFAN